MKPETTPPPPPEWHARKHGSIYALVVSATGEQIALCTGPDAAAHAALFAGARELRELLRQESQDRQCAAACNGPHEGCPCWYCSACAALAKTEAVRK